MKKKTHTLEIKIKVSILRFVFEVLLEVGWVIQENIASDMIKIGANIIISELDLERLGISFLTSLRASLKGWKRPLGPNLLGPKRKCAKAISFRSIKVKKAMLIIIGIIIIKVFIIKGFPLYKS